ESQQQFRAAHQALANHYTALADEEVWENAHISEQYDSDDWRSYQTESLYHQLFANPKQAELQLITRALEGIYLSHEELAQHPLQAIGAEYQEDKHPLIKPGFQKVLVNVQRLTDKGSWLRYSDNLEDLSNQIGADISQALSLCWQRAEKLAGLAKFVAYFYQGKYGPEHQKLAWLNKAKTQAKEIITLEAAEFSSDLLIFKLGITLGKLERYEDAISSFDEALKHKPDDHKAWYNRGIALDELGHYEDAIMSYNKALKHKPGYHEAWNNRGIALSNLKRYEDAISSYTEVLKHKPSDHEAYYNKACCYALLDTPDAALANLQQAINLAPGKSRELAKTDTDFDSLRNDPHFQALIQPPSQKL
ncbi:MAG: tetratricopeptide repeat protein, partial [Cyanobacteria bacterium P01_H01_bin.152]